MLIKLYSFQATTQARGTVIRTPEKDPIPTFQLQQTQSSRIATTLHCKKLCISPLKLWRRIQLLKLHDLQTWSKLLTLEEKSFMQHNCIYCASLWIRCSYEPKETILVNLDKNIVSWTRQRQSRLSNKALVLRRYFWQLTFAELKILCVNLCRY